MSSQFAQTLNQAADAIEIDAVALKECHQVKGSWFIIDASDFDAYLDYKNGMALVARLRAFAEAKGVEVVCE